MMLSSYNSAPPPAASSTTLMLVQAARTTCRELIAMLLEENAQVQQHKVAAIDAGLPTKKRLTLRLEQLLVDIKKSGDALKADARAKQQLVQLAQEVQYLQEVSRTNEAVLKAAHQLRADVVMTIRDAVEANQPRATTYGANGYLRHTDANTRLVARSV